MSTTSIPQNLARVCMVCEALLVLLLLPTATLSQEASAAESGAASADALEEIIVYGEAPLIGLRLEVYRAEDHYFATFNALNSKDEFDIRCRWVAPTGTRIRHRECRAKFVDLLEARATREDLPLVAYFSLIQEKEERLNAEMRALLVDHPELLSTLNEFGTAADVYEAEKERRCAGRLLFCRK